MNRDIKEEATLSANDLEFILNQLEKPIEPNEKLKSAAQLAKDIYFNDDITFIDKR